MAVLRLLLHCPYLRLVLVSGGALHHPRQQPALLWYSQHPRRRRSLILSGRSVPRRRSSLRASMHTATRRSLPWIMESIYTYYNTVQCTARSLIYFSCIEHGEDGSNLLNRRVLRRDATRYLRLFTQHCHHCRGSPELLGQLSISASPGQHLDMHEPTISSI